MSISNIIKERRSIYPKEFTGARVSDAIILKSLEAAHWAPSHKKTEPWRFKVFSDAAVFRLMKKLADLYEKYTPPESYNSEKHDKFALNALKISHAIGIVSHYSGEEVVPEWEETAAVSMAIQNLWLSLTAEEEVGGYWGSPRLIEKPEFENFLGLKANEKCLGIFFVGALPPNFKKPAIRGSLDEKITWIKI